MRELPPTDAAGRPYGGEDSNQGVAVSQVAIPERLLTPAEVAEILSVSSAWVLDHSSRRRPRLPSVKLGKAVRFRRADVEAFILDCARLKGSAT